MNVLMRKLQLALTPQAKLLKTTLSNGAIVYGKNSQGFGGRGIYVYRDAIEPEFEHLEKFLDSEGVFVDVGANTGIYTVKAAKHFHNKGTVLAIEPFPDVFATLFQSVQANRFTNVRLRNCCAGERTGSATLWLNQNQPNSFSLVKREEIANGLSTLILALDDLFIWEELNRLDYLKIDVEGAEQQVILGGIKVLEKYRPIIQIEVTFNDISVNLSNYSVFRADESPNKICIPNESTKIQVCQQLGWKQVSN